MKKVLLLLTFLISVYSVSYAQCTPSVTIFSAPSGPICSGMAVTFTAMPTNGGTPIYKWTSSVRGILSSTASTYTSVLFSNGEIISVEMTSSLGCASPTTAMVSVTMSVYPIVNPYVSITVDNPVICSGQAVTFTANTTNAGPMPTYQWLKNAVIIPSATNSTYTTTGSVNGDSYSVEMTSSLACAVPSMATSPSIVITVSNGIAPGTIGTNQTICYNTVPAAITQLIAPSGIVGTPIYQWEASVTGSLPFTPIVGATNATYTPLVPITQDIYIRRVVTDMGAPAPCNVANSNVVHITVRPQLVAGVIGVDETICSGAIPSAITQTSAPTGGTGFYTYQWQSDISGAFSNISGATNANYTPPALTSTTRFQRIETSGPCGTVTSNVVTKTITAPEVVTAVIDNTPTQECASTQSIVFTANGSSTTGTGTLSYQWYLGATPVGTNSPTYTYSPVLVTDNGKTVSVRVTTSTGCNAGTATSNVTLNIVGGITPTVSISGNPVNCAGLPTTFTATSTGGGSGPGPTYQWYVVPAGSPAGTIGIATGSMYTTYTTSTLSNGDRVYVEMTSSSTCLAAGLVNPFKSNEITMTIKPIPNPAIIEGDQTMCSPNTFTYHATVNAGSIYQWLFNNNPIAGATNTTYTAIQSGTYSIREDNGTCNATSAVVNLTVIPVPLANAGPDQYVLASSNVILNASGGNEYSWVPSTYLSNTTIANPTLTADQSITYTVTVSDPSRRCLSTDDVTIHVTNATPGTFSTSITGPNPVPAGQQNAMYGVPNQTGFTYTWSITGGTIVSGQNTNSVTVNWDASASHSISVLEKNPSNQTKTTTAIINVISTAVVQSQTQAGINVFPNPTTGTFNIEMPESGIDVTYEILDATGRSVGRGTFTSSGSNQQINADFGAGMYQVVLKYNNVVSCVRLSKVQ